MILKGPAERWQQMTNKYRTQGNMWFWFAGGCVALFVALLVVMLYNVPSWTPQWNSPGFVVRDVKGTIVLALIVPTMACMLRMFVRLGISAIHVSRDAMDRLQLTNVYLALLTESKIADNERGIVMQALFSRADTGRLKGDSTPAMPDPSAILAALSKTR